MQGGVPLIPARKLLSNMAISLAPTLFVLDSERSRQGLLLPRLRWHFSSVDHSRNRFTNHFTNRLELTAK